MVLVTTGGFDGRMRQPRIKIPPTEAEATYHCTTRTVNGEWLFDETAKEVLRRQLWLAADFCGIEILTYEILSNHFHVLVRVPRAQPVSDPELLRRFRVLYPKPTRYQAARLKAVEAMLASNGSAAMDWRRRMLAQMGDLSSFMKLVKQRFSIWFNRAHNRFGTLWAERFKSVLVESGRALQTMAAYIDLNSVRAGIVTDPKDYRFGGYAEAIAGNEEARKGICELMDGLSWEDAQASYRQMLFGVGTRPREGAATISLMDFQRVLAEGGRVPLPVMLRCRLRYFTDGAVLGSAAFVETSLGRWRRKLGKCRRIPHPLPPWTDWGDLATLHGLRQRIVD